MRCLFHFWRSRVIEDSKHCRFEPFNRRNYLRISPKLVAWYRQRLKVPQLVYYVVASCKVQLLEYAYGSQVVYHVDGAKRIFICTHRGLDHGTSYFRYILQGILESELYIRRMFVKYSKNFYNNEFGIA